jgi:FKBP-type peptidyl-prolyl cis-trans isomerase
MKGIMNHIKISELLFLVLMLFTTGCESGTWEKQERKQIDDYVKTLGDTVYTLTPSGLYYIELLAGTGLSPIDNDTVYFKYKASFLDYTQFDYSEPYSTPLKHTMGNLDEVISGVDEGLRYMREKGKARLLTPSSLAFGFEGKWQIVPGYTPLLWFIELDSVKAGPGR